MVGEGERPLLIKCNTETYTEETKSLLEEVECWGQHVNLYKEITIGKDSLMNTALLPNLKNTFDFISIEGCDILELDEEVIVDLILRIAETGVEVWIKVDKDSKYIIKDMLTTFEVKNIRLTGDIEDSNPNLMWEVFDGRFKHLYDLRDFLTVMWLSMRQAVLHTMNYHFSESRDMNNREGLKLVLAKELEMKNWTADRYYNYAFNFTYPEPLLSLNIEEFEDLLESKWRVFEYVKKLNPDNMQGLSKEVVTFCNSNEFIPFEDAISIINGEYSFLKYYNGGEN